MVVKATLLASRPPTDGLAGSKHSAPQAPHHLNRALWCVPCVAWASSLCPFLCLTHCNRGSRTPVSADSAEPQAPGSDLFAPSQVSKKSPTLQPKGGTSRKQSALSTTRGEQERRRDSALQVH